MLGSRRAGIVALVVALAVGLFAAMADGKKKKRKLRPVGTHVTLTQPSPTQFTGTAQSKREECRYQRLITLYYTDPNTGQTQPLSVQRTDRLGIYRIDLPKPAYGGSYHAVAPHLSKRGRLLCRAGESNHIAVPGVPLTP